ncbi:hypothetical protein FSP39_020166 [Pinctada imbricata]|uniref:Transporter n=1 Tax=Pinctada imbricata TaxID=66713 RepID=A0AA89BV11_PINIB|nr:hypothetical protein FSP39_020166 [Pinctada imbricata]
MHVRNTTAASLVQIMIRLNTNQDAEANHSESNGYPMNVNNSKMDNKSKELINGQMKDDFDVEDDVNLDDIESRDVWSGKLDFILSCVGFAVGLGNIWRFPYLCYKNGGGAFFIPYLLFLVCGGIPILMLEVGLGQYTSLGGLAAWNICPLFQGIGVATLVVVVLLNLYYIIILSWAAYYLVQSFSTVLPWSTCDNDWNTDRCSLDSSRLILNNQTAGVISTNVSSNISFNISSNLTSAFNISSDLTNASTVDPTVEFWERKVLQISGGIDQPGGVIWELAICLLVVWIVVYFCVWRGIRWTGKVVYFTATFPYLVLLALLIRGLTLDGAVNGIVYYLKPDLTRLMDPQVWIDGGTQIFFSYAIALGAMIGLGSYNKFNNNFYRDCTIIACINSGTSVLGGFVVFSVLGFMAKLQNVDIDQVADKGPGLAFITYPKAVSEMPLPQLWAVLFFVMIFTVGLDSQFVGVESFVTHFVDIFPRYLYKRSGRMIFTGVYCAVSYIIGLTMVTKGGMYVFQLFDYYAASGMVLLWLCFWEAIVIGWIFGADRFYDAIEMMIGYRPNVWLKICWKYLTPLITLGIFVFHIVQFSPLKYNLSYEYPGWAQGIGIILALLSMVCVPVVVVKAFLTSEGSQKEVIISFNTKKQILMHSVCNAHSDWLSD